jgi:lipopolysaccharide/colanic/teichoic acid biosynthesis glycosyltransferase
MFKYPENMAEQVRKFEYEFDYLKNRSFRMDLRIILQTVKIAVLMKGT